MLLRFLSSQSPPISSFHREQSFLLFWPCGYSHRTRRSRSSSLNAVDKESQFEIDREKAREALQKLDEQLETLSQKQITPKKRLPSSLPPLGTLSLSLSINFYIQILETCSYFCNFSSNSENAQLLFSYDLCVGLSLLNFTKLIVIC